MEDNKYKINENVITIKNISLLKSNEENKLKELILIYKLVELNSIYLKGGMQEKIGKYISYLIIITKIFLSYSIITIIINNQKVVGGSICFEAMSSNKYKKNYCIDSILIIKELQSMGLGKKLIMNIEEIIKKQGNRIIKKISIKTLNNSRNRAINFYLSCGYKVNKSKNRKCKFIEFYKEL